MSEHAIYLEFVVGQGETLSARPRVPLGERPLDLGRGPENDVVVDEETVSWRHAAVWIAGGRVRLRDHGSTNGTWIDEARLDREGTVEVGQVIRLGRHTRLRVVATAPVAPPEPPIWRLEVSGTGLSVPVPTRGLRVGLGAEVDLSLPLPSGERFALVPTADGAEVTTPDGGRFGVPGGGSFSACGQSFRLLPANAPGIPTVGARGALDRYRLRVALGTAPAAVLEDPATATVHRVTAENRVSLLYFLAGRLLDDRAAHVPEDRQGWCRDEEVATAVWGRDALRQGANNLNVLVHRLRRDLHGAGFDEALIERRTGALRLRLVHVARD